MRLFAVTLIQYLSMNEVTFYNFIIYLVWNRKRDRYIMAHINLATEMSDNMRAKSGFNFSIDALKKVVDLYKERKYVEELTYINDKLGGMQNLFNGLLTSAEYGISNATLKDRTQVFGTHAKEPPVRTGFCTMLKEALDDFMLKILIGCAVF